MKKTVKIFLSAILFLFLIAGAAIFYLFNQIKPVSSTNTEDVRVEIEYGTSIYTISQILQEKELIKNQKLFYYAVRYPKIITLLYPEEISSENIELKSGIYHLNPTMNYAQIVNALSSGRQEYIKVSIPEGLTISKIGEILEENGICSKADFKALCYDENILFGYDIPGPSLEGFLFPDTYFFTSNMKVQSVIDMMVSNFFDKVSTVEALNGLSAEELYSKVKLASIVEREYRIADEAPLIASVFVNRLKYNIGLYSCATVEYILTEIEGRPHPERILIEDTKIDSPYNTYKYAGLPPTPISNPGMVALNAAANPAKTKYYFFQIVDPQDGRHVFTTTFDEHIESHNLYTKKR